MQKLAFVAIIGLTACGTCLSAAVAAEYSSHHDGDASDFRPECEPIAGATATSRDLDWDGSDHAGFSVGGHATYTPGKDNMVHVGGEPQLLAHLRVRNGNIELDCNDGHFDHSSLVITLPGREFKSFDIAGTGSLSLRKLNQPTLDVAIAGAGSIKADGKVEHAGIHIAGSGDIDLGQVATQIADVHIAGSGNADIAPSEKIAVHIAGSGDVNLHASPKQIESHIVGSGRIRNVESGD